MPVYLSGTNLYNDDTDPTSRDLSNVVYTQHTSQGIFFKVTNYVFNFRIL
jgi:hypothetical protein